jgi:hypothetical protein
MCAQIIIVLLQRALDEYPHATIPEVPSGWLSLDTIKDVCFNDPNSTFEGVELRSLRTIFRVMFREYKTVEAAKRSRFLCPAKTSPNLSVFPTLSKTSKSLSGWGLYYLYNSHRCSCVSQHSSQLCPRSSVRVLPWSSRTWLCATKSACFRGPQENARN